MIQFVTLAVKTFKCKVTIPSTLSFCDKNVAFFSTKAKHSYFFACFRLKTFLFIYLDSNTCHFCILVCLVSGWCKSNFEVSIEALKPDMTHVMSYRSIRPANAVAF